MFPPDSWPPVPLHLPKVVLRDNEALQRVKHPRYPSCPMGSPGCQDPESFSESVPSHSHWRAGLPHPELSVPCLPGVRSHVPCGGAVRRAAAAPAWRLPHTLGTATSHGASPCPPPPLRPSFLYSIPRQPGLGMIWGHLGERWGEVRLGRGLPGLGMTPLLLQLTHLFATLVSPLTISFLPHFLRLQSWLRPSTPSLPSQQLFSLTCHRPQRSQWCLWSQWSPC